MSEVEELAMEIADEVAMTEQTVKNQVSVILARFPVDGRIRAVLYSLRSPNIVEAIRLGKQVDRRAEANRARGKGKA